MSADRLADIKAREQAAFGGPWEALDADENGMHAVAVDGTVLVEVGDFCDAEFIAHAREDVPWLVERVRELIGAICWDTTCLNCSSLLDSNYDQYMRAEKAEAEVERLTEAYQWTDQVLTAVTAERDALIAVGKRQAARLARVEAYVLDELRAALAGSEADTTDTQPTDQEDQS
jgi:hypothetical protein